MDLKSELELEFARLGPERVCRLLGIRYIKQSRVVLIRCLLHNENTPSMSVSIGRESRTIRAHCFACEKSIDVHTMVGTVEGLDPKSRFRDILRRECELLNMPIEERDYAGVYCEPEKRYPPKESVELLWENCLQIDTDPECARWIASRALDPKTVKLLDLCRTIPSHCSTPRWAYGWKGAYNVLFPMWDSTGTMVSLRARANNADARPKAKAPYGCRTDGIVLADNIGAYMLRTGEWLPTTNPDTRVVCITEGEPDYMLWASQNWNTARFAVFGIVTENGWTKDIASRIPSDSNVLILTHDDKTGDKYAAKIARTLDNFRGEVRRAGQVVR